MIELLLFVIAVSSVIIACGVYALQKRAMESSSELSRMAASLRLCQASLADLSKRSSSDV